MNHTFILEPRDVLFFRDARPMAASDVGQGAIWPRPDQIWHALIHAFHRQWPERQSWEGAAHTKRANERPESSDRFGALQTFGPFPCLEGNVFLPCPLDWNMRLRRSQETNLPAPLTHAFLSKNKGKASLPEWISLQDYRLYLAGHEPAMPTHAEIFDIERNIGIAINPQTGTTGDDEHKLYQAEYLRLRQNVTMAFTAACAIQPKEQHTLVDVLARTDMPKHLVLGGQQGVAGLRTPSTHAPLDIPTTKPTTCLVRWTLLSPAVYNAGWRPDWVAADGKVMLPNAVRTPDMSRKQWKELSAKADRFNAQLIAARIGKPLAFSGWDLQSGPKPTLLAVPAGSAYVFQCADLDEARALAVALSCPHPRSTMYGEKGFGIGVCSSLECGPECGVLDAERQTPAK